MGGGPPWPARSPTTRGRSTATGSCSRSAPQVALRARDAADDRAGADGLVCLQGATTSPLALFLALWLPTAAPADTGRCLPDADLSDPDAAIARLDVLGATRRELRLCAAGACIALDLASQRARAPDPGAPPSAAPAVPSLPAFVDLRGGRADASVVETDAVTVVVVGADRAARLVRFAPKTGERLAEVPLAARFAGDPDLWSLRRVGSAVLVAAAIAGQGAVGSWLFDRRTLVARGETVFETYGGRRASSWA